MKQLKTLSILLITMIICALIPFPAQAQDDGETERPTGWTEDSHGKDADPNYAIVFPQDEVNTITITLDPANWQTMLDDMTELYGEFGTREGGGERPGGGRF